MPKKQKRKTIYLAVKVKRTGKAALPSLQPSTHEPSPPQLPSLEKKDLGTVTRADSLFQQRTLYLSDKTARDSDIQEPQEIQKARLEEVLEKVGFESSEIPSASSLSASESLGARVEEAGNMFHHAANKTIAKPDGARFSAQEVDGIERIFKHRQILAHFSHQMALLLEPKKAATALLDLTEEISATIDALEQKESDLVVYLKGGAASFSIPWIRGFASACLEFKREPKGAFSLCIHNRGVGVEDPEIHGKIRLKLGDRILTKTSVKIAVPDKERLKNTKFLNGLFQIYCTTGQIEQAYDWIKKWLIQEGGKIETSPLEKENGDPPHYESIETLRIQDPSFDFIQRHGTKNCSSLTLPEKWMASPEIQKYLSLYSVIQQACVFKLSFIDQASPLSSTESLHKHTWHWKQQTKSP